MTLAKGIWKGDTSALMEQDVVVGGGLNKTSFVTLSTAAGTTWTNVPIRQTKALNYTEGRTLTCNKKERTIYSRGGTEKGNQHRGIWGAAVAQKRLMSDRCELQ